MLAGGPLEPTARLRRLAAEAAFVVAADSGLAHAAALGVRPQLLVGDMDSVRSADEARWPHLARERHPTAKDALDLELALDAARARGATRLRVMGAFGGRLDQTLATLLIGARLARDGLEVALHGDGRDAHPLAAGAAVDLDVPAGVTFSLLALTDPTRASVRGARFELDDAALPFGSGLGVSNESRARPRVRCEAGLLVVVVERR